MNVNVWPAVRLAPLLLVLLVSGARTAARPAVAAGSILRADTVRVSVAEGMAPPLPWLVPVVCTGGTTALRQVRWTNSARSAELLEASAEAHPAGSAYTVRGYVLGDGATPSGFPVTARVSVVDGAPVPPPAPRAAPLPLQDVTLTGDNRLTANRDLDTDALLALDITQQLYNYRDTYGLPTGGYTRSDGWDAPDIKLKGHGSGHYMSALALAFASCPDRRKKGLLRQRMKRMVDELRLCQERTFTWSDSLGRHFEARDVLPGDRLERAGGSWADFDRYKRDYAHYGYGYLNAIPPQHPALTEAYRPYNNEQWLWAPYYTIHKQLAGLIDIARYTDDRKTARKALLTARDMGLWVWNRMHYRTFAQARGTRAERRSRPGNRCEMWNMYIAGEVGGMSESLARLAEMVTDTADRRRLAEAAQCFDAPEFYGLLARNVDDVRGRHANQHIPMITWALRTYRLNGAQRYYRLARNFWSMVQGRYRYAPGGVGNGEMFRQPYAQMASMGANFTTDARGRRHLEPTLNETCCAYNLAKLTRDLNGYTPDNALLMDYYERVLYNQIVGSVHPHRYQTTYQYAVGLNASKPLGNTTPQSTCCGGTGAENHVKYQEAAYFANDSTLWVALYMPTTANWRAKGVVLSQECAWPADRSVLRVTKGRAVFSLKLRVPAWAVSGVSVRLNGQEVAGSYRPCSYVEIPRRRWKAGDVVEVTLPFSVYVDYAPDKWQGAWAGTLMYGPLAMTATGIGSWQEAAAPAGLEQVKANGPTAQGGTDGHLYTLDWGRLHFVPDYAADRDLTHYLLFRPAAGTGGSGSRAVDCSRLDEMRELAAVRVAEQLAWERLKVKVPEKAPWAPHAFGRMKALADSVRDVAPATQEEADQLASRLSRLLNAMRPGTLPEPEDLQPLLALLAEVRPSGKAATPQGQRAVGYAEMVVRYVSDGSGTADMISKAIGMLKAL